MAAVRPSGSTPLPAAGNRPSVIAIDGDAMRGATVGTATGLYANELVERANMVHDEGEEGKSRGLFNSTRPRVHWGG